jgi:hypothetical protein
LPTISVVGLRGRYNETGQFLVTTTTPAIPEDTVPNTEPLYVPQIVNGGGFTTQFVVFGASSQSTGTQSSVATEYFSQWGYHRAADSVRHGAVIIPISSANEPLHLIRLRQDRMKKHHSTKMLSRSSELANEFNIELSLGYRLSFACSGFRQSEDAFWRFSFSGRF